MTADHLSYQRATSVSVIGLITQAVMATVMLLYGIFGSDIGAINAAYAMYLGLPVWFSLALVFHQHKLERIEAMEAEAYRGSAAADASVFEGIAQDQTVQSTRLTWMHKWFLPVMGLIVGGSYIGVAAWLWAKNTNFMRALELRTDPNSGWAISVGVGIAVISFIFARFVAGMAKQKVWALLHAGSASAVFSALMGLALMIAHFAFIAFRADWGLRYMPVAVGVIMIALGAEMILHFVLNLYRPRKPGEWLRPAFDSRVLAFVAAPDRLAASISDAVNYQFGFNVSSTWFYRLISRSVLPLLALVLLTIWGLTCFQVVRPDQRALVLVGGRFDREVGPGLVIKKPWPFDEVIVYPASAVSELTVGTARPDKDEPILWTNQHSGEETLMLVQPWAASGSDTARDLALLAVEVPIHYTITDLRQYKLIAQDSSGEDPERTRKDLLTATASSVVIKHLATYTVDQLLGARRAAVSDDLGVAVQRAFDAMHSGVKVRFVGVAGVHPKQDVAPAFESVVAKDQIRETEIEKARKDEIGTLAKVAGDVDKARAIIAALNELESLKATAGRDEAAINAKETAVMDLIEKAGGEASSLLSQAKAARWQKSIGEKAKAVRIEGQIASYRASPRAYQAAAFLDALRSAASSAKVYVTPFDNIEIIGNYEEIEADVSSFRPTQSSPEENQK